MMVGPGLPLFPVFPAPFVLLVALVLLLFSLVSFSLPQTPFFLLNFSTTSLCLPIYLLPSFLSPQILSICPVWPVWPVWPMTIVFSSLLFGCCWHVSCFWILQSLTYFSRVMLHDYELKSLYAIDIFRLSPSQGKECLYFTCDPSFAAQGCCTSLCNSFTMTRGPLIETDHRSTKTIGILESCFWFTARAHKVPPLRDIDPNGGTWYQSNRYYASSLSEGVCTRRNALI